MNDEKGSLYVIAAPSGGGKTSLVRALISTLDHVKVSVSYTTRPSRPKDVEGVDYFFVTRDQFKEMIAENVLLEYALVYGNYYGTSRQWVETQLAAGFDVILEIDCQGADSIFRLFPESIGIFILPPSPEELTRRLQNRNQDASSEISRRLAEASSEIAHYAAFDYLVVNRDFDEALADLLAIFRSQRLTQPLQAIKEAPILAKWLKKE